ncbi:hypothetical protein VR46_39575 [Streptomyces sp. NRRL S-444]|nr:hypothetical protein VR46_39575 [Streptomyces sp. NRRL S-444]
MFNFKIARYSRSEQGECAVVRKMTGRRTLCVAGYATTAQYAAIGIVLIGLSLVTEGPPIERSDWLYSLVWLAFLSAVLGLLQAVLFATPTALIGEALARRLPGSQAAGFCGIWHPSPSCLSSRPPSPTPSTARPGSGGPT